MPRPLTDQERQDFLATVRRDFPEATADDVPGFVAEARGVLGYGMTTGEAQADLNAALRDGYGD